MHSNPFRQYVMLRCSIQTTFVPDSDNETLCDQSQSYQLLSGSDFHDFSLSSFEANVNSYCEGNLDSWTNDMVHPAFCLLSIFQTKRSRIKVMIQKSLMQEQFEDKSMAVAMSEKVPSPSTGNHLNGSGPTCSPISSNSIAKPDSVRFINEKAQLEDGLNEEQIMERENYLEEIRVALEGESKRLEKRIENTLERFNSEDSNSPLVEEATGIVLQRCRSYSSSDIPRLKSSRKRKSKLKRDPSQTLPSSPILQQERTFDQKQQLERLLTLEKAEAEVAITDSQCLFVGGLILDPKRLFGKEQDSLTDKDVRRWGIIIYV